MLLTQAETAELLRLSERTLERWRVVGGGPVFCKLGKRVLYRRPDLDEWIASHLKLIEHQPPAPSPPPLPPHGTVRQGPTPDRRFRRG